MYIHICYLYYNVLNSKKEFYLQRKTSKKRNLSDYQRTAGGQRLLPVSFRVPVTASGVYILLHGHGASRTGIEPSKHSITHKPFQETSTITTIIIVVFIKPDGEPVKNEEIKENKGKTNL